jgi:hypothetical protein
MFGHLALEAFFEGEEGCVDGVFEGEVVVVSGSGPQRVSEAVTADGLLDLDGARRRKRGEFRV